MIELPVKKFVTPTLFMIARIECFIFDKNRMHAENKLWFGTV
jgi:hypothetical protein